jgi:EAL domain-containing protein (putative c-di-GMP-specific phosphodiesterase class I)
MLVTKNDQVLTYLRSQRSRLQHMRLVSIDAASLKGDDRIFFQQYLKVLRKRVIDLAAFGTDDGRVLLFVHGLRSAVIDAHLEPLRGPHQNIRISVEELAPYLPKLISQLRGGAVRVADAAADRREAATWAEINHAAYTLERADLSQVLFNQPAFALADYGGIMLYAELFVSIAGVERLADATTSFTANRWAFRDLTLTLDRLVLRRFNSNGHDLPGSAFSLNLNVASVLSEAFAMFAQSLSTQRFGTIMVEFHRSDVFEDLERFEMARSLLNDYGMATAIDGVDFAALPLIDFAALGVDFIKLTWNERFLEADDAAVRNAMAALNGHSVPVILTRCDHAKALTFARRHGIGVVQGRTVEKALAREGGTDAAKLGKPGTSGNPFLTLGRPGMPTFGLLVS